MFAHKWCWEGHAARVDRPDCNEQATVLSRTGLGVFNYSSYKAPAPLFVLSNRHPPSPNALASPGLVDVVYRVWSEQPERFFIKKKKQSKVLHAWAGAISV